MKEKSISAFQKARFGMFIHFGLYSIPGGRWNGRQMDYIGEWIQAQFRIPNDEYSKLAERFNPHGFNADEWVRCAKEAGMAYIVFTAKHHDGFAMYHSRVCRYNIVDATPFGRDILRELAYSCKRHDMKLGIYYSHCLDWHDPNGADPGPNAPKNFGMSWGNDWDFPDYETKDFSRYFEQKAIPQVRELLTEYGEIFLMWFDCPIQISPEQGQQLRAMVKELQPGCLINSRIGHNLGDFGSLGDNQHPAGQTEFPMESPNTLNHTWGFKWDDHGWMNARNVISNLAGLNDRNVNFLLNIGPRPNGRFPEASMDVLHEVFEWRNAENVVIQDTLPNPFPQSFPWGWCTVSGNIMQFFVNDSKQKLIINGLRNTVTSCSAPYVCHPGSIEIIIPESGNSLMPVIKLTLDGEPDIDQRLMPQSGVLELMPVKGTIVYGTSSGAAETKRIFGPAAEVLEEQEQCFVDNGGALTQWHHPGDGIAWEIFFPEGGCYEISAVTENRCHSSPWVGGRTIDVRFAQQSFSAELHADEIKNETYYSKAVSTLGVINVSSGESGIITIRNMYISNNDEIDMNLTVVKITNKEAVDERVIETAREA